LRTRQNVDALSREYLQGYGPRYTDFRDGQEAEARRYTQAAEARRHAQAAEAYTQ
jgi:hypothetical protein